MRLISAQPMLQAALVTIAKLLVIVIVPFAKFGEPLGDIWCVSLLTCAEVKIETRGLNEDHNRRPRVCSKRVLSVGQPPGSVTGET